jgi:hypothetical protein
VAGSPYPRAPSYSLFATPYPLPLSPALAARLKWLHPSAVRGSDELPAAGRCRGGVTYARRHCPFRVRGVGGCRGRPATGPAPHGWRAFWRQGHPLRARFNSSPAQWRDRGPSTAVYRPGPRSRRAAAHPPPAALARRAQRAAGWGDQHQLAWSAVGSRSISLMLASMMRKPTLPYSFCRPSLSTRVGLPSMRSLSASW